MAWINIASITRARTASDLAPAVPASTDGASTSTIRCTFGDEHSSRKSGRNAHGSSWVQGRRLRCVHDGGDDVAFDLFVDRGE